MCECILTKKQVSWYMKQKKIVEDNAHCVDNKQLLHIVGLTIKIPNFAFWFGQNLKVKLKVKTFIAVQQS